MFRDRSRGRRTPHASTRRGHRQLPEQRHQTITLPQSWTFDRRRTGVKAPSCFFNLPQRFALGHGQVL